MIEQPLFKEESDQSLHAREAQKNGAAAVGRDYFVKRAGWRWEVWFRHSDGSADPASGATEWRASWGVRFWRKLNAMRITLDMQREFNDGLYIGRKEGGA